MFWTIGVIGASVAGLAGWIHWSLRHDRAVRARLAALKSEGAIWTAYLPSATARGQQLNGRNAETLRGYVLAVLPDGLRIYPIADEITEFDGISAADIRWFGRPHKYRNDGVPQEMRIHVQRKTGWYIYEVWLTKHYMVQLVRAMKQIVSPELVKAYRRRRPYVHFGPREVCMAKQTIHGEWELSEPYTAYLTPLELVFLVGPEVVQRFSVAEVQDIQLVRKLDETQRRRFGQRDDGVAEGIMRFRVGDVTHAMALRRYDEFAEALAQAAKRSLEEPVTRKQKLKDDDDDD